ncbi:type IV secretion system DNA-binding domain-containing protein [uncultured Microbulbifer sp.]|uniref:type IV secretory system conjugative DNA transfer family protein n=1 Tax=uncultured Microbulbifer sp. TaxID=348147 RepID=UPI00260F63DF|nr:type IV secretion system DNA-binding domain-containing protein [uncultured Microbulbifer sp.]
MDEWTLLNWMANANYQLMRWTNESWFESWALLFFIGSLIAMSPLRMHHEHSFPQVCTIWVRKIIIGIGIALLALPIIEWYVYDITMRYQLGEGAGVFLQWLRELTLQKWPLIPGAAMIGFLIRFTCFRYGATILSRIKRKIRNVQSDDKLSDVKEEIETNRAKDFDITKHYRKGSICVGIDENGKPIWIPFDTFIETNAQVIGPTRYGKGIIMGGWMDQAIQHGNAVIYIDPKHDKYAPHILYAAAQRESRPFYYLALHDKGPGRWGPFVGGDKRDALARLQTILGLEMTGDPGTDYYKSQERNSLESAFEHTRRIDGLLNELADSDANRLLSELKSWSYVKSLCPPKRKGFSIEKALKEGAVVYVQGSLDDQVVKAATKSFIIEVIQEARRLDREREHHLTFIIDEVKFLVSRQVAEACATVVGFRVNMVLGYQSLDDLLNPDDKTLNGQALKQSVNINSQIKAVYGGSDFQTAQWIAEISGSTFKETTRTEKTEIQDGGAEVWEKGRTIGSVEENLITTNKVLTLPRRVCAFVQPGHLAIIAYTSPVPVKSFDPLNQYVAKLEEKTSGKGEEEKPESKKVSRVKHSKSETPPNEITQKRSDIPVANKGDAKKGGIGKTKRKEKKVSRVKQSGPKKQASTSPAADSQNEDQLNAYLQDLSQQQRSDQDQLSELSALEEGED